jgi:hypothetical protein
VLEGRRCRLETLVSGTRFCWIEYFSNTFFTGVTTSSRWAGHDTQNLDALHTLDSSASLPLIDRATETFDSRSQAVMGNTSTTFNPSSHAQLGSKAMLFDSSTNAQQGNSFHLFNPSNHVQLGNPDFCNTALQEQMRNTYTFFDPSSYVRQGNCTSFDVTLQEQMQNASTFFDPSSYVRQGDLSILPEPLLSFHSVHTPALAQSTLSVEEATLIR